MRNEEVWLRLAQVFEDVFGEPVALTEDTRADDVPGWDSVRSVELMVAIEEAFGVRLKTSGLAAFASLGQLAAHLKERAG